MANRPSVHSILSLTMTRTECERYIEEEREREKGLDFSLARYIYHPSLSALTSQQRYQRVVNNLTQPMFYAMGRH